MKLRYFRWVGWSFGFMNAFPGRQIRGYEDFVQGLANCCPLWLFEALMSVFMSMTRLGRRRFGRDVCPKNCVLTGITFMED